MPVTSRLRYFSQAFGCPSRTGASMSPVFWFRTSTLSSTGRLTMPSRIASTSG